MSRSRRLFAIVLSLAGAAAGWAADAKPAPRPADGVYLVRRQGPGSKELLPLKEGEVLLVDHHRFLKNEEKEPPRYLVVRSAPDVSLDLAAAPEAVKEDGEVVRILLKLKPKPAAAPEKVTKAHRGGQVAIVVGGDVVTVHKVRAVISGGAVQISNCAPGAAGYLLKQLQESFKRK
jgi:hypothetical protein